LIYSIQSTDAARATVTATNATNPNLDHIATHICPPTRLFDPATTLFYHPVTRPAREQSHFYPERVQRDQRPAADRDDILVWLRSSPVYPQAVLYGRYATPSDDPTEPLLEPPLSTILQKSNFPQLCVLSSS
jgi:hypothetical protein